MKKRIIPAIITAAAAFSVSSLGVTAAEGENLAVLGDSIATGYGLDGYVSGDGTSAADSFANRLSADYSEYDNLAVDGRTSAQLLGSLSDEATVSVLEKADDVVISIGGNDLLQPLIAGMQMSLMSDTEFMQGMTDGTLTEEDITEKMSEMDLEKIMDTAISTIDLSATEDNIGKIFSGINEINPDCDIYILTVYNPFDGESEYAAASDMITELNGTITSAAHAFDNVTVVDVYSSFKGKGAEYTNITEMDIHPNKAGHEVIYGLLKDAYIPANKTEVTEEAPAVTEASAETVQESAPAAENTVDEVPVYAPASDSSVSSPSSGNTGISVYFAVMAVSLSAAVTAKRKSVK